MRKKMSNLHKVFVYGTLKRGEPNHHWFKKGDDSVAKFLFEANTVQKFPLIIGTKYNIPFLLYKPGTGFNVQGEVYEVNDVALKDLDELEDHPNYYVREKELVKSKDGSESNIWIYFLKNFKEDLLNKPFLETYSNEGNHGLKYMERYLRNTDYDHKTEVLPMKNK